MYLLETDATPPSYLASRLIFLGFVLGLALMIGAQCLPAARPNPETPTHPAKVAEARR